MNEVEFLTEDIDFSIDQPSSTIFWLTEVANKEGFDLESLTYVFCSDTYLLSINQQYLQHDYFTDIITFDNSISETSIHGDIFISIDRVKENSRDFSQPFENELYRVMVHGLLHLCGYKDKTESEQKLMRQKEDTYISLRLN
jgi:probable rRNA maturation factor